MLIDPKKKLQTCDPILISLVEELSTVMDIVVVCGHRGKAEQDAAFKSKNSKVKWPNSAHNSIPSRAVDIAPANDKGGIDWNDLKAFNTMQDVVRAIAVDNNIELYPLLKWDLPHVQLQGRK